MTLTALARTLGEHAYNFILHSAPLQFERAYHNARAKVPEYYHWHIEIIPRGASITGFEYGTGFYINATMPETAAESLRAAIAAERGTTA
jgi:UDPglucose--hexose-1-phosphate uridylyltransferase